MYLNHSLGMFAGTYYVEPLCGVFLYNHNLCEASNVKLIRLTMRDTLIISGACNCVSVTLNTNQNFRKTSAIMKKCYFTLTFTKIIKRKFYLKFLVLFFWVLFETEPLLQL